MFENTWRREALPDVVNLALGLWLVLTPWIFGFTGETAASWTAWITGLVIAGLAIAALAAFAQWEEWTSLAVGLWAAIAPWAVGFAGHASAMRVHLITGLIVAVVAAVRLWLAHHSPPRVTA